MLQFLIPLMAAAALVEATNPAADAKATRYEQLYRETGNAALLWLIAEAHAEAGHEQRAIAALERVAELRLGLTVTADSPLSQLSGKPGFDEIAARLKQHLQPTGTARVAATLDLPRLIPEGLAVDPRTHRFFIGDMAGKRILVLPSGDAPRLFATTGQLRPIGMKIDASRGLLWVAATTAFVPADKPDAAVLGFDLNDGHLRRRFSSPELKSVNDLALAPNGDIYITDSLGGALFRLRPEAGGLERVTPAEKMGYPNGVAVSSDGRSVYVAQGIALRLIDTSTGAMTSVRQPANLALLRIDGLYWHDGSLLAVQNGGSPGRILRLHLSNDGTEITSFDVLQAASPHFDLPTTGDVLGGSLYFIANSQLRRLGNNGEITAGEPLRPIRLLQIELTPASEGN